MRSPTVKFFAPFILWIFILLSTAVPAQVSEIDSLLLILKACKPDTQKLILLNSLGKEFINVSDYAKVLQYSQEALVLADSLENIYSKKQFQKALTSVKKHKGETFNTLGNMYADQGEYAKALDCYFNSLRLREECGDKKGVAASYNNIGLIHYSKDEFDKALGFYFKALKNYEAISYTKGMGMLYNNIGVIYKRKNNYEKALEFYYKSLKIREELGNKKGIGDSYHNIAVIYSDKGDYPNALDFYIRSLGVDQQLGNKKGMAVSHNGVGSLYLKLRNLPEAKKQAQLSLDIAKEIGSKDDMRHAYFLMASVDSASGNFKNAYHNHINYVNIKDSIFNEESNKKMVQAEMNFEFEKKEALAKVQQEKKDVITTEALHRQTTQRNAFSAGFILMIVLAGLIYKNYRNKKKAHAIIEQQKVLVETKNKDITDSINYAKNIQQAILPFDSRIAEVLKDFFVLFNPRDIVSGDFYWFTVKDNYIFIAVADCTGHGVPGAFMSMIGSATLTHIVSERGILDPGKILSQTNRQIKQALKQSENNNRDGMDISLLRFEKNNFRQAHFAGALRTLYHISGELNEIQGNKTAIGGTTDDSYEFKTHEINLKEGDTLYMTSDGYPDQFGGPAGKKFRTGNFKKLLLTIGSMPIREQKETLEQTFNSWKGNLEQLDDVCVIGIKI